MGLAVSELTSRMRLQSATTLLRCSNAVRDLGRLGQSGVLCGFGSLARPHRHRPRRPCCRSCLWTRHGLAWAMPRRVRPIDWRVERQRRHCCGGERTRYGEARWWPCFVSGPRSTCSDRTGRSPRGRGQATQEQCASSLANCRWRSRWAREKGVAMKGRAKNSNCADSHSRRAWARDGKGTADNVVDWTVRRPKPEEEAC